MLDGAIGVEDGGGDGIVGAGTPVEQGAGGGGDFGVGMLEDLFEEGDFFAVVGGDVAVGQAGGVEGFARTGSEEGGDDPESDCCSG